LLRYRGKGTLETELGKLVSTLFKLVIIASFLAEAASTTFAGVVVSRTDKGFQFADAVSINVNGKDKVLNLGSNPKIENAGGKLSSIKLGEALYRDQATSYFALDSEGSLHYILPEGSPKGTDLAWAMWGSAHISAKGSDKTQTEVPTATFVAFLPGNVQDLVDLARSEQMVRMIDSSPKSFATQLSLISAIVKNYPQDPACRTLQKHVEDSMRSRYEQFENGTANFEVLEQGLQYAELSQSLYPALPEQAKLRDQLAQRKRWLDRKAAVLRAFAAANAWDQFIISDGDFEPYERSFQDLAALRKKALQASLEQHRQLGEQLMSEREFGSAYRQFRLASMRQPSDKLLQQRAVASWASYSREVALDSQRERKQLGVGEREILNQAVQFATNYKIENKLDLALKSINEAERIDPDSLPMLLKKAEILGARSEFADAFETLDRYDRHAVDEEREKASTLRNELLFKQTNTLEDVKDQIQKALREGNYVKLHELAVKGLRASDTDPDLLYQAATASAISRDSQQSRTLLTRYLTITNTLDANFEQRAKVRALLASDTLTPHVTAESGTPNWLSGRKLPPDIFYCPISLAFQPRIEHIDASGKMKVDYEWNGDHLVSITPTFEKAEKNTGEPKITFAYNDKFAQVVSAVEGDAHAAAINSADPDDLLKHSAVVVLNNPYIDPDSVEKLTGKNVSIGISGNRYFEPFVWDHVHYFRFSYDAAGRVARAMELVDQNGSLTGFTLDFEWDGQRLTAVHGFQASDPNHRSRVYDRTLQYEDGKLVAEDISGSGKSSHIKYNYNGGRLASAQCSADSTLDDRSRQVTFR